MRNWYTYSLIAIATVFALVRCNSVESFEIDNVEFGDPAIGIPLINSTFLASDFGTNPNGNTSILTDDQGRLIVRYNGQVLRKDKEDFFLPIPYPDTPLSSNSTVVPLPNPEVIITEAVFQRTNAQFKFVNTENDNLTVYVTIPELSKNGETFAVQFIVPPSDEQFISEQISLEGWLIETGNTTFTVNYIATLPNGEDITFDDALLAVDVLEFSYGQGNFGYKVEPLSDEIIDVNVFSQWVSGGISFDQPTINFSIENSFGFPIEADFQVLEIVTISGDTLALTGPPIENGIAFDFPLLGETGNDAKITSFSLDGSNSNIGEIFNEKAASVIYDVDAIINSESNPDQIGFFDNDSYFTVDVSLDLPMSLKANDLVMADTLAINSIPFDTSDNEALFKLKVVNAFPMDLSINLEFLDVSGNSLFQLVDDAEWITATASPDVLLRLDDLPDQDYEFLIPEASIGQLVNTDQVVVKAKLSTLDQFGDDFVWLYTHHGLDVKLGAIIQ